MTATLKMTRDVEYMQWLVKIEGYKAELAGMQKELEGCVSPLSPGQFSALVEQFQNRFIRQREVIDILRHDVKAHENDIQLLRALHPSGQRNELGDKVERVHNRLRREVQTFVDLFVELEQDFNDFIA